MRHRKFGAEMDNME